MKRLSPAGVSDSRRSSGIGCPPILRFAGVVLLLVATAAAAEETLVIGEITIRRDNVYSEDEVGPWVTRTANAIHTITRERFVRGRLLFATGDVFDPVRLEETERNLRSLPFIKSATVVAGEPHDGRVDIEVVTQDSWSLEPGLSFGSKGAASRFAFDITERNLMGRAMEVRVRFEDNADRSKQMVRVRDHSLFGPYLKTELRYSDNSDGSEQSLLIERPFFSTATRWSLLAIAEKLDQHERIYRSGVEVANLAAQRHRFGVGWGLALSTTPESAKRLLVGVDLVRDQFSTASTTFDAPADRDFRYVWVEFESTDSDFRELTYVDRADLVQDFNLGTSASVRLGLSPTLFGTAETTGLVSARFARGFSIGDRAILLSSAAISGRVGPTNHNTIVSAELQYIGQLDTSRPQTSVALLRIDRGWDLDGEVQFFADGDNGLRGYRLHSFEGDTRIILNAEHRVFLGRELFKIVSPGIALFADVGAAVPEDRGFRGSDLKMDAGLGLFLGMTRSSRNVIRVNLAWAFDRDPLGRSGLLVSVTGNRDF